MPTNLNWDKTISAAAGPAIMKYMGITHIKEFAPDLEPVTSRVLEDPNFAYDLLNNPYKYNVGTMMDDIAALNFTAAVTAAYNRASPDQLSGSLMLGYGIYPVNCLPPIPSPFRLFGSSNFHSYLYLRDDSDALLPQGYTDAALFSAVQETTNDRLQHGIHMSDITLWGNFQGQTAGAPIDGMYLYAPHNEKRFGTNGDADQVHYFDNVRIAKASRWGCTSSLGESHFNRLEITSCVRGNLKLINQHDTIFTDMRLADSGKELLRIEDSNDVRIQFLRGYFSGTNKDGSIASGSAAADREQRQIDGAGIVLSNATALKLTANVNDSGTTAIKTIGRVERSHFTIEVMRAGSVLHWFGPGAWGIGMSEESRWDPAEAAAVFDIDGDFRSNTATVKFDVGIDANRRGQFLRNLVRLRPQNDPKFADMRRVKIRGIGGHVVNDENNLDVIDRDWAVAGRIAQITHLGASLVEIDMVGGQLAPVRPTDTVEISAPGKPAIEGSFQVVDKTSAWKFTVTIPAITDASHDGETDGKIVAAVPNMWDKALRIEDGLAPWQFRDVWIGMDDQLDEELVVAEVGDGYDTYINQHSHKVNFSTSPRVTKSLTAVEGLAGPNDRLGRMVCTVADTAGMTATRGISAIVDVPGNDVLSTTGRIFGKAYLTGFIVGNDDVFTSDHDVSGVNGTLAAPGPSLYHLDAGMHRHVIELHGKSITNGNSVTVTYADPDDPHGPRKSVVISSTGESRYLEADRGGWFELI